LRVVYLTNTAKTREDQLNLVMSNVSYVAVVSKTFFHLFYRDDARVACVDCSESFPHRFEININVTT
jgi:hypothetical protein